MGKDTISAREQHTSPDHLSHNASHWPYIHWKWTFRWQGGGHANKNGEEKGKKRTQMNENKTKWEECKTEQKRSGDLNRSEAATAGCRWARVGESIVEQTVNDVMMKQRKIWQKLYKRLLKITVRKNLKDTRIQSLPGKRILCRTISASMQPTDHMSTEQSQ